MRRDRFEQFAKGLIEADQAPAIAAVATYAEAGFDKPSGLKLGFVNGATIYLTFVHGAPAAGDRYDQPEPIIEQGAPQPVPAHPLQLRDGKVALVDVEQWIKALVINSGSREIAAVEAYSEREKPGHHPYGVNVRWHSTGTAYVFPVQTLPAGHEPREQTEYKILEVV